VATNSIALLHRAPLRKILVVDREPTIRQLGQLSPSSRVMEGCCWLEC
jgi:hypothetical protein